MAQMSGQLPKENRWLQQIKTWLGYLAFAAVAFLIGLYIVAPRIERNRDTFMPESFTRLPTGIVELTNDTGGVLLPIRIADSTQLRNEALRGVGGVAFANKFVLFAQSREMTSSTTYNFTGVRVPLDVAVISAEGKVLSVHSVALTNPRLNVSENHRWLLIAKAGTFEPYGIKVDSQINPEGIRKINL